MLISIVVNLAILQWLAWSLISQQHQVSPATPLAVRLMAPPAVPEKTLAKPLPPMPIAKPVPKPLSKPKVSAVKPVPPVQEVKPQLEPPQEAPVVVETSKQSTDPPPTPSVVEVIEVPVEKTAEVNTPLEPPETKPFIVEPLFHLTRQPIAKNQRLSEYYPEDELALGREATVLASILINDEGKVVEVDIVKSGGTSFDAAAKKALLENAFEIQPGYIDGRPVAVRIQIPVVFDL